MLRKCHLGISTCILQFIQHVNVSHPHANVCYIMWNLAAELAVIIFAYWTHLSVIVYCGILLLLPLHGNTNTRGHCCVSKTKQGSSEGMMRIKMNLFRDVSIIS